MAVLLLILKKPHLTDQVDLRRLQAWLQALEHAFPADHGARVGTLSQALDFQALYLSI